MYPRLSELLNLLPENFCAKEIKFILESEDLKEYAAVKFQYFGGSLRVTFPQTEGHVYIKDLEDRIVELEKEVSDLEYNIEECPSEDEVYNLEMDIQDLKDEATLLEEEIKTLEQEKQNLLDKIEKYERLMNETRISFENALA